MPSLLWHCPHVFGHVERIDRRARVSLWKDGVRIAVATCAGMVLRTSARCPQVPWPSRHGMCRTDFGDLIGMGIFLDIDVTIIAPQAAVNTRASYRHLPRCYARGVLHALVGVTGKALRLRCNAEPARQSKSQPDEAQHGQMTITNYPETI